MNSTYTWIPGPAVVDATREALELLRRHYPRAFAALGSDTPDGRALLSDYASEMRDVAADAIPQAARQWISQGQKPRPPMPGALAESARVITRRMRNGSAWHGSESEAPEPIEQRESPQSRAANHRAYAKLRSWHKVSDVWGFYVGELRTSAEIEAYRRGDVDDGLFDKITTAVANGAKWLRPRSA